MNKRLEAIYNLIDVGVGVVDVGTDHGYLPAALAKGGYRGNIIASDINSEPLKKAEITADTFGVHDKIKFLLCDGLSGCEPSEVDTIVIAGMGGDTICGILDRAEWCMTPEYTLILQPMTKCEILRFWLANNGYEFINELLVKDGGTIYQIIKVRIASNTLLADAELFTGKYELAMKNDLFNEMLVRQIGRFQSGIKGLEVSERDMSCRLALWKDILHELLKMKEKNNG